MSETLVEQSHQLNISGHNVSFGTRGIALTGSGHAGTEDPLHDTDYTATCLGKSSVSELVRNFDEPLPDSGVVCSQIEAELRRALEHQEFRVYYQPIVYLETSQIAGCEALLRWQHPTRGLLSPVDFLQATEETGLIVPIGLWVLREASRQMHQWHLRFPENPPLYLSVNISSKQFQQPDLVGQISQILHETGLNPASLKLEITETLVMQNSESARNILLQLRALNVKLAIDDFGTGYSSLSYLQKFPVHTLKIDHSFISKLQDAKESLVIVRAVVTLAHNLGLDVIAEGIETANHVAMLKVLKCEFGQGYFYSKPFDTERAEALIVRETQAQFAMSVADATEGKVPEQGEVGNAIAPTFGSGASLEDRQERNQSSCSIADQFRRPIDVDVEVQNQGLKATGGQSDSTGTSRNKKLIALLAAVAAVIFGATLDLWTNRQNQNPAASSAVQLDKPAPDRPELSEHEATAKSHYDQGNLQEASAAGVSGAEPKHLLGAGGATLATSNNPVLSPETLTYAVIHDHLIGSCRGKLKISGGSIVFEPSEDTRHGFAFKLTNIIGIELGDTLKIKFKQDVYRFKAASARNERDNRSKLAAIDQRLNRVRAEVALEKH